MSLSKFIATHPQDLADGIPPWTKDGMLERIAKLEKDIDACNQSMIESFASSAQSIFKLEEKVRKLEKSIYYPWREQNLDGDRLRTDHYKDRINGVNHRQDKLEATFEKRIKAVEELLVAMDIEVTKPDGTVIKYDL